MSGDKNRLDINNLDEYFIWAAESGYLELVKLLLDVGADIKTYDYRALKSAAQYGHLEVVNLLRDRG